MKPLIHSAAPQFSQPQECISRQYASTGKSEHISQYPKRHVIRLEPLHSRILTLTSAFRPV
jgi:hypothetical protein